MKIKVVTNNAVRLHELVNAHLKGKVVDMYTERMDNDGLLYSVIVVKPGTDTLPFEKAVNDSLSVRLRETVVWESPNRKWSILRNWKNDRVRLTVEGDTFTDTPILYPDSDTIAYDNPYRIPAYVRERTNKLLLAMRTAGVY